MTLKNILEIFSYLTFETFLLIHTAKIFTGEGNGTSRTVISQMRKRITETRGPKMKIFSADKIQKVIQKGMPKTIALKKR